MMVLAEEREKRMNAVKTILEAKTWQDIFPQDTTAARKQYRLLIRTVHPDVCSDPQAEDAFIKLRQVWAQYKNGDSSTSTPSNPSPSVSILIDASAEQLVKMGDRLFWVVKNPSDNDLVEGSGDVLRALAKSDAPQFFPKVLNPLKTSDGRRGYEVTYPEGTWSLNAFNSLDDRTIIWVFKRLLVSLILTHEAGYVHGDISKNSILLIPSDHGLILDNWAGSVPLGKKLKIQGTGYIPPEYLKGKEADEWLDIAGLGKLALEVGQGSMNLRLQRYFKALASYKVTDARMLLNELEELSESIFGKPRWHDLNEPTVEPIA